MNLTTQQQNFINRVANTTDNLRLDAVAGSGKTSTLLLAAKQIPTSKKVLALAFNKNTADELQAKFPSHVTCKTLNSVVHSTWASAAGRKKLDTRKMGTIVTDWCKENLTQSESEELWTPIRDIAVLMKSSGLIPESWQGRTKYPAVSISEQIMEKALIDEGYMELKPAFMLKAVSAILSKSIEQAFSSSIDFDDQIYMTTYFAGDGFFSRWDVVLIDEAQDLSIMQHDMLERIAKHARVIVAGDPNQAIYGWRGASTDSMERLSQRFNLKLMPLTVSFRCPSEIVRKAKALS